MIPLPVISVNKWKNRNSYVFDGVNEGINIDAVRTALAATTVGTFSFWFRPSSLDVTQIPIGFGDTNANEALFIYHNTITLKADCTIAGTTQWNLQITTNPLTINAWHHIALIQDGTSPVLYVNGAAPAQTFAVSTNKTRWFSASTGLDNGRIGCQNYNNGGNTSFLNGNLDEFGFFNTALTLDKIIENYNWGKPKNLLKHSASGSLVSSFRMGDGDSFNGTNWTLYDKKGTNNATSINMEISDLSISIP